MHSTSTASGFSGNRLREHRELRGFSREQLAVATGRSFQLIYLYERGRNVPPTQTLGRLANALGCSVADFFEATP